MKKRMDIFFTFFMIGLTTFGGGYGMLAVMQNKLVHKKHWLSAEEMIELLAISEASPGPFAINAATFIGYKRAKFFGSVLATLGVVLPSLIISVLVALFVKHYGSNLYFNAILKGISAGVSVIILMAFIKLGRKSEYTVLNAVIFLIAALLVFFNVLPIYIIILIAAISGIFLGYIRERKEKKYESSRTDD